MDHVGYVSRACGFDLDGDGRVGEAEDCRICDGRTLDPDGDGIDEDLIYVDCQEGRDDPLCGTPDRPCATVTHAWTARADGPEDGAEDIVCFRGTCRPDVLTPAVSGLESTRSVPARGPQDRDFLFPEDPTMLVGWDSDGDGEYPPFDGDDEAVLDGAGLSRAFHLGAENSFLEMAHFSVRDYGRYSDVERSGFVHLGRRGGLRADGLYFHDLELSGINQDQPAQGHRIVFNYFNGGTNFHHVAFVNLRLDDVGGFMVRGAGAYRPGTEAEGGNDGPFRWQNLSVTAHGCDHSSEACRKGGGSAFIGWKLWGWIDGIEILQSRFDAAVDVWEPKPAGNGGALFVNATQCSRGWTIRGNEVLDFKVGVEVQGGDGAYCGYDPEGRDPPRFVPRRTGDVSIDRNVFFNRYGPWRRGDVGILLKGGEDAERTVDRVRITNNVIASLDGFDACILLAVGHGDGVAIGPAPDQVEILNNTCFGARAEGRSTGFEILKPRGADHGLGHLVLRNNFFVGLKDGDYGLRFRYRPPRLVLSGNIVSPAARFAWRKQRVEHVDELLELLNISETSRECEPAFVDPATGDFHLVSPVGAGQDLDLSSAPACGLQGGDNLSFWLKHDLDGDPRPDDGTWAVGADQP